MKGGIYTIRIAGYERFYVGKAKNLTARRQMHFWQLKRGVHSNVYLQAAYAKHGVAGLEFRVEFLSDNADERTTHEQWWLDTYLPIGALLNLELHSIRVSEAPKPGRTAWNKGIPSARKGVPRTESEKAAIKAATIGKKRTLEQRARISAANAGRSSDRRGVVVSEETRRKIAAAQLGKKRGPRSAEVKAKISSARKGVPLSEAHKAALRIAARNRKVAA